MSQTAGSTRPVAKRRAGRERGRTAGRIDFEAIALSMADHEVPRGERRAATTRADKGVQRRTATRRRRVARLVFDRATALHRSGLPYEKVVDSLAVSTVALQAMYAEQFGAKPSRDTLLSDLDAILGAPSGKLAAKYSDRVDELVQANTYSLRDVHKTLGRLGRKLTEKLHGVVLAIEFDQSRRWISRRADGELALSPISVRRIAQSALRRAIDDAVAGNRHHTGVRFAWRLAHVGVPEPTARGLLRIYQDSVGRLGGRRYEPREARRAVTSAYRKVAAGL